MSSFWCKIKSNRIDWFNYLVHLIWFRYLFFKILMFSSIQLNNWNHRVQLNLLKYLSLYWFPAYHQSPFLVFYIFCYYLSFSITKYPFISFAPFNSSPFYDTQCSNHQRPTDPHHPQSSRISMALQPPVLNFYNFSFHLSNIASKDPYK